MPARMAKQRSLDIVPIGQGAHQLISNRKIKFPDKSDQELSPSRASPVLQPLLCRLAIPTKVGTLQNQSQVGVIVLVFLLMPITPLPLAAKPQSSTLA